MKNKLIKAIAGIGFLVLMTITFTMSSNQMNQNSDVTLENIAALNEAEAESSGLFFCFPHPYLGCKRFNGTKTIGWL